MKAAVEDGGRIVVGGERLELNGGHYFKPTVIAGLDNDARTVQEEIFGPVLTVQPFDTEEEAIALANSTPYGLAAGLQTSDLARAHRVAARLDRHRLGQRLGHARSRRALRRRQAVRLRARIRAGGAAGVHEDQVRRHLPRLTSRQGRSERPAAVGGPLRPDRPGEFRPRLF